MKTPVILCCAFCLVLVGSMPSYAEDASYRLTIDSKSKAMSASSDDFFDSFSTLSPGDSRKARISIANDSDSKFEVFLSVTPASNQGEIESEKAERLLSKTNLAISNAGSGKELFRGKAAAASFGNTISLGTFKGNAREELVFNLSVPNELGNDYSMMKNAVKWTFTAQKTQIASSTGSSNLAKASAGIPFAKTGSSLLPLILTAASLVFLAAAIELPDLLSTTIRRRRKGNAHSE